MFVRERTTGTERPGKQQFYVHFVLHIIIFLAPVPYENYYNPRNTGTIPGVPTLASIREPPHKELPPIPPDEDTTHISGTGSSPIECDFVVLLTNCI